MHATVLEALKRSTEAITDGVPGTVPWEVACDAIEEGGFRTQRGLADGESLGEDFFHGLGHGVGVEVHEAPYMGLGCKEPLAAGDVVTVEPGVYRKDYGGVRLEDLVVVTGGEPDVLTRSTTSSRSVPRSKAAHAVRMSKNRCSSSNGPTRLKLRPSSTITCRATRWMSSTVRPRRRSAPRRSRPPGPRAPRGAART
jgi:Xaa-Pro aminopeptidase